MSTLDEALKSMAMHAPMKPIELRVNPLAPRGKVTVLLESERGPALVFHSEAERDVWLDGAREQGLRG